ncbi:MAG: hypothetical protein WA057_04005 [Candidatus Magasanikiibacteriota bacterium]
MLAENIQDELEDSLGQAIEEETDGQVELDQEAIFDSLNDAIDSLNKTKEAVKDDLKNKFRKNKIDNIGQDSPDDLDDEMVPNNVIPFPKQPDTKTIPDIEIEVDENDPKQTTAPTNQEKNKDGNSGLQRGVTPDGTEFSKGNIPKIGENARNERNKKMRQRSNGQPQNDRPNEQGLNGQNPDNGDSNYTPTTNDPRSNPNTDNQADDDKKQTQPDQGLNNPNQNKVFNRDKKGKSNQNFNRVRYKEEIKKLDTQIKTQNRLLLPLKKKIKETEKELGEDKQKISRLEKKIRILKLIRIISFILFFLAVTVIIGITAKEIQTELERVKETLLNEYVKPLEEKLNKFKKSEKEITQKLNTLTNQRRNLISQGRTNNQDNQNSQPLQKAA